MTNDRRKSWYVVVRHHAKVPTTSYIEWQPNSGIKCIFQQLSWTSTYSTKYQNFVQKPICSTGNPPLTRFPLTRYPLMWFSKKQIFSFSHISVWDFVFKVRSWHILGNCHFDYSQKTILSFDFLTHCLRNSLTELLLQFSDLLNLVYNS